MCTYRYLDLIYMSTKLVPTNLRNNTLLIPNVCFLKNIFETR